MTVAKGPQPLASAPEELEVAVALPAGAPMLPRADMMLDARDEKSKGVGSAKDDVPEAAVIGAEPAASGSWAEAPVYKAGPGKE